MQLSKRAARVARKVGASLDEAWRGFARAPGVYPWGGPTACMQFTWGFIEFALGSEVLSQALGPYQGCIELRKFTWMSAMAAGVHLSCSFVCHAHRIFQGPLRRLHRCGRPLCRGKDVPNLAAQASRSRCFMSYHDRDLLALICVILFLVLRGI